MKHVLALIALSALALPAIAGAQTPAAHTGAHTTDTMKPGVISKSTEYVREGKTIDKITCRDFVATEDKFKPETLSYAVGYGKHGHAKDAVVDVGGIEKMVPVVVSSCNAHPTDSLLARLSTIR